MLQIRHYTFNQGHTLDLSPRLQEKTSNISHEPLSPWSLCCSFLSNLDQDHS